MDSSRVCWEAFYERDEFGVEVRIFGARDRTWKPPNLRNFSEIGTFHRVIEHVFLVWFGAGLACETLFWRVL